MVATFEFTGLRSFSRRSVRLKGYASALFQRVPYSQ